MTQRLDHLDTWRAIAVGCVILAHLRFNSQMDAFVSGSLMGAPFLQGMTGVYVFFFISGLVVARSAGSEVRRTKDFSVPAFYTRRIFRIVPPLMLYLLACALFSAAGFISFTPAQFAAGSLYVCNIAVFDCGWYAGHLWSLAFEEQFYLLFPMLFAWVELRRRPPAPALFAAIALSALPFLFSMTFVGRTGFFVTHALFLAGYACARRQAPWPQWNSNWAFALAALITFFPCALIDDPAPYKYQKFFFCVSIPVMVIASAQPDFVLRGLFRGALLTRIGRASYSIYLWQQLLADDFARAVPAWVLLVAELAMVIACVILYERVERPIIEAGRRFAARHFFRCASSS